jgi:putative ABC transport system permease protein
LFALVYKKISKNKWMFLSMLVGFVLSTTMLSSIPIYTQGITQKVLTKDMEKYQVDNNKYPASYNLKFPLSAFFNSKDIRGEFDKLNENVENKILTRIDLPTKAHYNKFVLDVFSILPKNEGGKGPKLSMMAVSGIEEHAALKHGRIFSPKKENNVIEVIATEQAMQNYQFILDNEYSIDCNIQNSIEPFKIKVVGVFENKEDNDSFWNNGIAEYNEGVIMDYSIFKNQFLSSSIAQYVDSIWYRTFDYHKINTENVDNIMSNMQYVETWSNKVAYGTHINALDILSKYNSRQKALKVTLLVLEIPVIIMLVYYLFMISQLIIEQDKKEIAVLKSRGADRWQIIQIYLLQGLILSGIAMLIGPPLGLLICNIVGSTNGFMEFVQRAALPLKLNISAYIYSLAACIAFTITMLVPAFMASKTTIVQHSRANGRLKRNPIFQRYYLDVILFGISCYGYYSYKSQQKILNITGVSGTDIPLNPFLFSISSVFIFSLGLLFVRLFPYIIKLVFKTRESKWKPSMYSLLINLSRSGGKNNFLIIFLVLTVSTGIFGANAARTINSNIEEREKYAVGADITVLAKWLDNQPSGDTSPGTPDAVPAAPSKIIYVEPNFKSFENLSGIDKATKVTRASNISFTNLGQGSGTKVNTAIANNPYANQKQAQNKADFMAIIPNEFGKIAWFRTDLLQYHWFNYLNFLTKHPNGLLVSSSMAEKNGINLGDDISVNLGKGESFNGTVLAIIDYWPGYNPYPANKDQSGNLIVANFNYLQAMLPLRPYEVWMKKQTNATSNQVYKNIEEKKLQIITLKDSSRNIIEQKNDPIIQGTNGALTLGFIVNLLITLAGFIIFWILNIKARTYQFGILRAMGLFSTDVIRMIFGELMLLSVSSIIIGVTIGGIASKLFVPLLQITGSAAQYVPPFKVTENLNDYIKLYMALFIMIVAGLIVLNRIISRININQALKLGED